MPGFNVDLPPLPKFEGLSAEDLRLELEDYLRKLTVALEETFAKVYTRGELVNREQMYKRTAVNDVNYTVTKSDFIVAYTALSAQRTVILPTTTANSGRRLIIKDEAGGAGANNIVIDPEGATTIDGNATLTISANYGQSRLCSDGTNWFVW
ncbi:hypothetical protein LCGC14_0686840 [marine sediment metagenome]|uniref:Uncharacterized protein n=1 Tax=marine sediment metagenome TaxID=412755 RepID=A0A0F9QRC6_9ZZZZ